MKWNKNWVSWNVDWIVVMICDVVVKMFRGGGLCKFIIMEMRNMNNYKIMFSILEGSIFIILG